MKSPAPWTLTKESLHSSCVVFDVYKEHFEHPEDGRNGDFYVAHAPDWVTVIPVTSEGKILLVNQFRFGIRELSWEFPGGVIDNGEDFLHAAVREVAEETGYRGNAPIVLGNAASNPAIFNNRCHFVLIENCRKAQETNFDENEEIEMKLATPEEVLELARTGKMKHALMLTALSKVLLLRPDIFRTHCAA
ncbi:MAG: NUDIX hydrolase [Opitutales bacterium]|nr:NUDIX hydrolase [Opitutales bacterium]